ncbi:MAG: DUF4234 domain-containing protein [Clostridia bacterium]|nr:DUF4234 domain-containing protein [Clostridia bacterium]
MLTKRSVASVIVFSILTCGIYMLWWTYVTCTALQQQGHKTSIPPVLTVLLMLFVSGVGGALLGIDADDNINAIKAMHGMPLTDNKILWIILGIIIPIVSVALIQSEINNMIDAAQSHYPPNGNPPQF